MVTFNSLYFVHLLVLLMDFVHWMHKLQLKSEKFIAMQSEQCVEML